LRVPEVSDKARFVKEIEEALLAGEVDLAVHSAKDVPSEIPDGLAIVGVPERADARDALCLRGAPASSGGATLAELPEAAVVGTASLRRRAALLALRPDLDVRDLRGNVDTRLRRLAAGDFDAIVLAQAGLERLGRGEHGLPLDPGAFVPAAGQGCLVLEARADDEHVTEAAGSLTNREALTCLTAERAVIQILEATCDTPIGTHAVTSAGALHLTGFLGRPDGSHWIRHEVDGGADEPSALGAMLAERLLAVGAADLR
jgi:hydroxymethylbilane synthase